MSLPARLLLALALLSATPPIAIDFYLASFPEMKVSLGTDAAAVQLTLTAFLVGLGVGQVLWGPVSDRFGRVRPLLVGCLVSTAASAAAALAPTVEVLTAARLVHALTGAAGVVIARAIVTDLTRGLAAARAMTLMMTIGSLAPVLAPIAGGALAEHLSWRWILGIVCAITGVQVLAVVLTVRETLPSERRTPRLSYRHLAGLLRRPVYLGYAATSVFTFGAMMTYISSSSFLYQSVLGWSPLAFGIGFGVNAAGMTTSGLLSARLARRGVPPERTVARALPVSVTACALVLLVAVAPVPSVLLVGPLFVVVCCAGFLSGNTAALALEQSRDVGGAGSALLGGAMFLFGGLVSPLGGLAGDDTAVPAGIVMVTSGCCAATALLLARRAVRRRTATTAAAVVGAAG